MQCVQPRWVGWKQTAVQSLDSSALLSYLQAGTGCLRVVSMPTTFDCSKAGAIKPVGALAPGTIKGYCCSSSLA